MSWLEGASAVIWGPLTMGLTLGVGGYLTVRTGFFPLRRFGAVIQTTARQLTAPAQTGKTTPFMAMSAALGATMGTGNIVGVATALVSGGPGAIVWMWIAAAVGMILKLAEVALAVRYRRLGAGPMGYLRLVPGIGGAMATGFAALCLAASLGMGNMTQSNSIAQALGVFSISPLWCAAGIGLFTFAATGGGVRGVLVASAWVVPVITVGYTAASAAAIWQGRQALPAALADMLGQALGLRAVAGGAAGYTLRTAMRFGVARGVFSNEAGMGSSPIAHAEAGNVDPVEQGMWGILEVFLDTMVSCTLTALALLTAGGGLLWRECGLTGAPLASHCFSEALGPFWGASVSVFVALFGLTSLCGWFAYGLRALEALAPRTRRLGACYRLLYAVGAALGALFAAEPVWLLCDLLTGSMMAVNLLGLLVLAPQVCDMVRAWERSA
ncbi:MAG: amino acid carrier protein [Oscillospiraceae bacterium]